MFSHVTIGTKDLDRVKPFWHEVMAVLGHPFLFEGPGVIAFGSLDGSKTFIGYPFDGNPALPGNGGQIAYLASSRSQVDQFHAVALAHGGSDEGPPGLRPHYHPNYCGAYVRCPDGNKLQAICHSPRG